VHVWSVHGVGVLQFPLVSHFETPLPEHCTAPEAHTPTHAPDTHVELTQGVGVAHIPFEPQSCTALPEHPTSPGLHIPVHTPPMHKPMHGEGTPHCPAASHVATPLPMHVVCPVVHTPTHAPFTQVWFVQAVGALQTPAPTHCSNEFPTHWNVPRLQSSQAPFAHTGMVPAQVAWLCHTPFGVHTCTTFPMHRSCAWLHTPEQTCATQVWSLQSVSAPQPGLHPPCGSQ
jgi:hypothetical protein